VAGPVRGPALGRGQRILEALRSTTAAACRPPSCSASVRATLRYKLARLREAGARSPLSDGAGKESALSAPGRAADGETTHEHDGDQPSPRRDACAGGAQPGSVRELPDGAGSFGDLLKQSVDAVDGQRQESNALQRSFELGETKDLATVMIASQKANLSFQAMVTVRNRLVEPTRT